MCKGNEPHSRATQSDIAIINYMMAKHGLERNQVMAQRDAKAAADEVVIKKTWGLFILTYMCKNVAHMVDYLCSVNQNK